MKYTEGEHQPQRHAHESGDRAASLLVGAEPQFQRKSWVTLGFITIFCLLNQWMRWLPVYLSSVSLNECDLGACLDVPFTPTCQECTNSTSTSVATSSYASCLDCHTCRTTYSSDFYNFEDGVCMTTNEYGVITGVGFAFTFSLFGLFAGFFVDVQAKRDSTILGVSALLCAAITLATSYCRDFPQVLVLRALLGAFQAFGAPASVHLIMTHFEQAHDRPIANAAYTVGVYLGAGLSSLSTLIALRIGWRETFRLAGYLGIITALSYEIFLDVTLSRILSSLEACSAMSVGAEAGMTGMGSMGHGSLESSVRRGGEHFDCLPASNERNPLLHKGKPEPPLKPDSDDDGSSTSSNSNSTSTSNHLGDDGFDAKQQRKFEEGDTWDHTMSDAETACRPDTEKGERSRRKARPKGEAFFSSSACLRAFLGVFRLFNVPGSVVPGAMPLLFVGSCLRFAASIATFVFVPVLVSRKFPAYGNIFSVFNAVVVLSCGSVSAFMGGKLGQMAVKQWGRRGLARLVATSCVLCVGPFVMSFLSGNFWLSMALLALGYLLGEAWMGASMALLQGFAPAGGQGLAMSLFLFLNWNLSAAASDVLGFLDPGTVRLARYMATFISVPILLSAAMFLYLDRIIGMHDEEESRRSRTREEE